MKLFAVTIAGQVWVKFIDSSDSVNGGNVRCVLLVVCWLVLVVICFLFIPCGGGVMIGSAIVDVFCWFWFCGAVEHYWHSYSQRTGDIRLNRGNATRIISFVNR